MNYTRISWGCSCLGRFRHEGLPVVRPIYDYGLECSLNRYDCSWIIQPIKGNFNVYTRVRTSGFTLSCEFAFEYIGCINLVNSGCHAWSTLYELP